MQKYNITQVSKAVKFNALQTAVNQHITDIMNYVATILSSHTHKTFGDGISQLPVCGCGIIYCLDRDRTSVIDNSNDS